MDIYQQLRHRLKEAAERSKADGMLLSGGLDTGILAPRLPTHTTVAVPMAKNIIRVACTYFMKGPDAKSGTTAVPNHGSSSRIAGL